MKITKKLVRPLKQTRLTLKQAEDAIGEPASAWKARCFEIASRLVKAGVVSGVAVYGHWTGPVKRGTLFYGKPIIQHGWVLLPDKTICDPTRWVFEGAQPYLYFGPADHYDEGGNKYRMRALGDPPPYNRFEKLVTFTNEILPETEALNFIEKTFDLLEQYVDLTYTVGTITIRQLSWLANADPTFLGKHAWPIYKAIERLKLKAFIPIDNYKMVARQNLR